MTTRHQDSLRVYGKTDQGLVRKNNQDSLLLNTQHRIFAVADGLGGLPEGAVASQLSIKVLEEYIQQVDSRLLQDFSQLFLKINERVFQKGLQISPEVGIGTTLTLAQIDDDQRLKIGHIGDSGLVVFNQQGWKQVTQDHTMAEEMLHQLLPNEHAFIPEYFHHTLTRCIGQKEDIQFDYKEHKLEDGDRLLLYTDGLTKAMDFDEVHKAVLKENDPELLITHLIDTVNDRGGPDNITAIAIYH